MGIWAGLNALSATPTMASTDSRKKSVVLLKACKGSDDPYDVVSLTKK